MSPPLNRARPIHSAKSKLGFGMTVEAAAAKTTQVSRGEGCIQTRFTVRGGRIGHGWTNPQTYDADDGSVVDW